MTPVFLLKHTVYRLLETCSEIHRVSCIHSPESTLCNIQWCLNTLSTKWTPVNRRVCLPSVFNKWGRGDGDN